MNIQVLFEAGYTQELMALGEADAIAQRGDIHKFFGWPTKTNPDE
jgi:NTE family protein